mgnify:CR=1 FL=1
MYIRQLSEEGLIILGTLMNGLNHLSNGPFSEQHTQYKLAKIALDIEDVLKNHITSIEVENMENK